MKKNMLNSQFLEEAVFAVSDGYCSIMPAELEELFSLLAEKMINS